MDRVPELLDALADAARSNARERFDRIERDLLAHVGGSLENLPEAVRERYLEIDRLWPVVPAGGPTAPREADEALRRTVTLELQADDERWLTEVGADTQRDPSAVVSECIRAVRADPRLAAAALARLRGRVTR